MRIWVYVNPDLLGALRALARDAGVSSTGYFFRSRQSHGQPMSLRAVLASVRGALSAIAVLLCNGQQRAAAPARLTPAQDLATVAA
jgi:hypothetical protein